MTTSFIYPLFTDTVPPVAKPGIVIQYDPYPDENVFLITHASIGGCDVTELLEYSTILKDAAKTHWQDINEPGLCGSCGGSGEGNYDGSSCRVCKGSGVNKKEVGDV
jgi:hypothetical protein